MSLEVERGSIAGLIGPNGAGKTTLFNTIAGIYRPDAGTIRLGGRHIDGKPPHEVFRAGLARTFQIPRPFPEMTVLENVMLAPSDQSGERFWWNWLAPARVRREEEALRDRALETIRFCGPRAGAGRSRAHALGWPAQAVGARPGR